MLIHTRGVYMGLYTSGNILRKSEKLPKNTLLTWGEIDQKIVP